MIYEAKLYLDDGMRDDVERHGASGAAADATGVALWKLGRNRVSSPAADAPDRSGGALCDFASHSVCSSIADYSDTAEDVEWLAAADVARRHATRSDIAEHAEWFAAAYVSGSGAAEHDQWSADPAWGSNVCPADHTQR
jgi:hypothetical protein